MKIAVWISIIAVLALAVLNLTFPFGADPDEVFPMTNQRIVWEK